MNKNNTRSYVGFLIAALLLCPFFQASICAEKPIAFFDDWVQSAEMRHASVGVEICAVGEECPLFSYDAQRAMVPASTLKLFTTATALRLCGQQSTVATEVWFSQEGNLIVRGHGNAMLASTYSCESPRAFVDSVAVALKRNGIFVIPGDIIGDEHLLPQEGVPNGWSWEDLGNYYAAGIYGLNYADNLYQLTLDTSRPGQQPRIQSITPDMPELKFDNQLSPDSYRIDSGYLYGAPFANERTLYGAIPHRQSTFVIKGDVPEPAYFAACQMKKALQQRGIKVGGEATSYRRLKQQGLSSVNGISKANAATDISSARLIFTHHSEPLIYIAKITNVHSNNLMAEMLMRQISLKVADGSLRGGIEAVLHYWQTEGMDMGGVRMYDGCGLSPSNRVTPHAFVALLKCLSADASFRTTMAVAGQTGTVRNFLKGSRLSGKAWLKTGTISQVITYAGYVEGSDHKQYAVSVMVNNYEGPSTAVRKKIEKLLLLLIP